MKLLRLSAAVFMKNKAANIMLMVMLFILLTMSGVIINKTEMFYEVFSFFSGTALEKSLYFSGREPFPVLVDKGGKAYYTDAVDPKVMQNFLALAEESGIVESVSSVNNFWLYDSEKDVNANVLVYDETTAGYLKNGMKTQGVGLYEYTGGFDGDCVPVAVYNSGREIGDIFEAVLSLNLTYPTTDRIENSYIEKQIRCVVVEKISSVKPFVFEFHTKGVIEPESADALFLSGADSKAPVYYFPYSDELFNEYKYSSDSVFAYFKDSTSIAQMTEFKDKALKIGAAVLGTDILDKTKENADATLKQYFFVIYTFAGMFLVAVMCVSILNGRRVMQTFSVYYLNGCGVFKSYLIYLFYVCGIYLAGFVVYCFISVCVLPVAELFVKSPSGVMFLKMWSFNPTAAFAIGGAGLLLILASSALPFLLTVGKPRIMLYKEQ